MSLMNHQQTSAPSLHDTLHGNHCVIASSVFDPVSARIARAIGAQVGVLGGSAASQVILGAPDIVLLTASELVEQARRICRTQSVPLVVDADHGYGNALNVMRTVQELQCAGVAAVCIEDSVLPREFESGQAQGLVSIDEGRKKMAAALEARGNGPMLIVARTNATATTGVEDAVRRLQAYEETGVDAIFVPYLKHRKDFDQIAAAVRLPMILGGCDESLFDLDYLAARGVRVWVWGHQTLAIATHALYEAMKAVHQGTPPGKLTAGVQSAVSGIATATDHYEDLTRRYLS